MMDFSLLILQASPPNPNIGFWDIVDFAIAAYLIYLLYKLLRGTMAFSIFIGVLILYILWWTVRAMNMFILSTILDQFVSVGVIVLVIIFQPEIRRFLLMVGSTTLKDRLDKIEAFVRKQIKGADALPAWVGQLENAVRSLSTSKKEAVLVIASNLNHESFLNSGVKLNANLSPELIESILDEDAPMSDGAVIIQNGTVVSADCVLPRILSDGDQLTTSESAAVGISEQTSAFAIVVNKSDGSIKYALSGELSQTVDIESLLNALKEHLTTIFSL